MVHPEALTTYRLRRTAVAVSNWSADFSATFLPLSWLLADGAGSRFGPTNDKKHGPFVELIDELGPKPVTLNHWVVGSIPTWCNLLFNKEL